MKRYVQSAQIETKPAKKASNDNKKHASEKESFVNAILKDEKIPSFLKEMLQGTQNLDVQAIRSLDFSKARRNMAQGKMTESRMSLQDMALYAKNQEQRAQQIVAQGEQAKQAYEAHSRRVAHRRLFDEESMNQSMSTISMESYENEHIARDNMGQLLDQPCSAHGPQSKV